VQGRVVAPQTSEWHTYVHQRRRFEVLRTTVSDGWRRSNGHHTPRFSFPASVHFAFQFRLILSCLHIARLMSWVVSLATSQHPQRIAEQKPATPDSQASPPPVKRPAHLLPPDAFSALCLTQCLPSRHRHTRPKAVNN
jgi:hypothetical protein